MFLKFQLVFPDWDVATLWALIKDLETRSKWDERIVDLEVLERSEADGCTTTS
jgi:hypothetical protein